MTDARSTEVLDCPMSANDANATTVRQYLARLLARLWQEGEMFSSKRPFGNSDWEWDVIEAVVEAGLATEDEARELVLRAIHEMSHP